MSIHAQFPGLGWAPRSAIAPRSTIVPQSSITPRSTEVWLFTITLMAAIAWAQPAAALTYVDREICCIIVEDEDIEGVNDRWGTQTLESEIEEDFYLLKTPDVEDLPAFAAQVMSDSSVIIAEPNYFIESPEAVRQMVVAVIGGTWDEYVDQQAMERIGLDAAHTMSTGEDITVAVLDTGIDLTHEVFEGRLSNFMRNYLDDSQDPSETANGLDDDGDGLIDEGYGHGTMVAGLVALIAPDAKIMPLRVLDDEGRGTVFNIARAITHATSHGAHVLNLSFGAPYFLRTIYERFHVTTVHGGIIVAGAGNRNLEEPPLYPASDERALMVTAVDSMDIKADFADYHPTVVVSAPGAGIRSAYPGGEWGVGSGCSFATPMVAGEVALILSVASNLDPGELHACIQAGVDPIYDIPENEPYVGLLGSGRIHLAAALETFFPAGVDVGTAHRNALRASPNPSTGVIHFALEPDVAADAPRSLEILDLSGRLIRTVPIGEQGHAIWTGRDRSGRPLPAGIYWARPSGGRADEAVSIQLVR